MKSRKCVSENGQRLEAVLLLHFQQRGDIHTAAARDVSYHGVGVLVHDKHAQVLLAEETDVREDGTQLDDLAPLGAVRLTSPTTIVVRAKRSVVNAGDKQHG
jgi:hypothetical protein